VRCDTGVFDSLDDQVVGDCPHFYRYVLSPLRGLHAAAPGSFSSSARASMSCRYVKPAPVPNLEFAGGGVVLECCGFVAVGVAFYVHGGGE
jgi:hypothetical protein